LTDRPYTVRCTYSKSAQVGTVPDFVVKELKPKKIALLCEDEETMRAQLGIMKEQIQPAGVEIVYQEYVPYGTTDLSPYITNIKHKNPDVLIGYFSQENVYTTLFKQIMEQGGWGSIKFVSGSPASTSGTAVRQAGAEGTYHWALWIPGFSNPASQKFEQDFREKYGKAPAVHHANFYLPLWGAIHAIELADSDDPQEIAQAARSGNLHWDTPAGPITILPNGETDMAGSMMVVENGALVPVATLTAASTATPTENHPTPTPTAALTINSTIGELYDNQDANKILRECLGDAVVDNPQFSMGFGFDLPTLVPMSGGKFTDAMVTCLDEGLKALAAGQKPTPTPTP
jgi:hypothetical protein